ncbi:MAG TPA: NnrS family protein [Steroidobacteraceae bacterium]|nr:NnrS family protein [Steroidobacteraceae bacterium]
MRLPAVLGYGFRPFFLAAALAALLLITWWAASLELHVPLATAWPAALWHGHEMVYGFIVAAVSGFLLTAVPSWTGARGFAGWPLVLLVALWLLGRLLVSSSAHWPLGVTAAADLAFLPALAIMLLPPLSRTRNRNTPLLIALAALCGANGWFYWAVDQGYAAYAQRALLVAVDIVLLLVTVIGGRIIPAFTSAALKARGGTLASRALPGVNTAAIAVMLAMVTLDATMPDSRPAGACALLAAGIQALRLSQWGGLRTLRLPIVWVLHLAYAWLPLGFALKALALLTAARWPAFWLHALTVGAAATMIMAVITRASLGHTGRPLVVSPITVLAYVLLTAAAAVRSLGPALPVPYAVVIGVSAFLWIAAFLLFLWVYTPVLLTRRVDGRAG